MARVYKLTTQDNKTRKGYYNECTWGPGVTHRGTGEGALCGPGFIHAYTHPVLAVILNPLHADIPNPKLWECETHVVRNDKGLKVGGVCLTTLREIPLPDVTIKQKVLFAVKCASAVAPSEKLNKAIAAAQSNDFAAAHTASASAAYAAAKAADYAAASADYAADYAAYAAADYAAYAASAAKAAAKAAASASASAAYAADYAASSASASAAAKAAASAADCAASASAAYAAAKAAPIDFISIIEEIMDDESSR